MPNNNREVLLLPVATLVGWLVCALIGGLGLWLPYPAPRPPATKPESVVEAVKLEVVKKPDVVRLKLSDAKNTAPISQVPELPPKAVVPEPPTPVAVVAPSAVVSFAIPVEGPTHIVDIRQAGHERPVQSGTINGVGSAGGGTGSGGSTPPATTAPVVIKLTYGVGEGQQPPPEYPRESVIGRQEGTVLILFNVDEQGRVTDAKIEIASRWPRLNQTALHTVREKWHFGPGEKRTYEIPIEFQLTQ